MLSPKEVLALLEKIDKHLIRDAGLTEFSEPTNTAIAIGPDKASRIDPLCGHLPLL